MSQLSVPHPSALSSAYSYPYYGYGYSYPYYGYSYPYAAYSYPYPYSYGSYGYSCGGYWWHGRWHARYC